MAKKDKQPASDNPQSERYSDDPDVRSEFHEAQKLTSGRQQHERRLEEHRANPVKNPKLSAGDIDAAWDKGDVGEETVSGDHPTPDQDIIGDVGNAVGLPYGETEPLGLGDKEAERDQALWELNPASSEDYVQRIKDEEGAGSGQP